MGVGAGVSSPGAAVPGVHIQQRAKVNVLSQQRTSFSAYSVMQQDSTVYTLSKHFASLALGSCLGNVTGQCLFVWGGAVKTSGFVGSWVDGSCVDGSPVAGRVGHAVGSIVGKAVGDEVGGVGTIVGQALHVRRQALLQYP